MVKPTRKLRYSNAQRLNALETLLQTGDSFDKEAALCEIYDAFYSSATAIIKAAQALFRRCLLKQVRLDGAWGISRSSSEKPEPATVLSEEEVKELKPGVYLLYNSSQYCAVEVTELYKNGK